jgi:hypothetical protein
MQLKQHNYSANPEVKAVGFIRIEEEIHSVSNCQCPYLAIVDVDDSDI